MSFRKSDWAAIIVGLMIGVPSVYLLSECMMGGAQTAPTIVKVTGGYMVFIKTNLPQEELETLLKVYIYPETRRGEE